MKTWRRVLAGSLWLYSCNKCGTVVPGDRRDLHKKTCPGAGSKKEKA